MNELIVALVTGGLSLLGTVITVIVGFKQTSKQVDAKTTLTLYRIEQLERKQDKHNTLIERTYKLEEQADLLQERVKVANHRIDDLEHIVESQSHK